MSELRANVTLDELNSWTRLSMDNDSSPTSVHRTILHAWRYVVRLYASGHFDNEEYYVAYWMLVRAYNQIDTEFVEQESWNCD